MRDKLKLLGLRGRILISEAYLVLSRIANTEFCEDRIKPNFNSQENSYMRSLYCRLEEVYLGMGNKKSAEGAKRKSLLCDVLSEAHKRDLKIDK